MSDRILTLASEILHHADTHGDIEFLLRNTTPTTMWGGADLVAYMPQNLSLAQAALVAATLLVEGTTQDLLEVGMERFRARRYADPEDQVYPVNTLLLRAVQRVLDENR